MDKILKMMKFYGEGKEGISISNQEDFITVFSSKRNKSLDIFRHFNEEEGYTYHIEVFDGKLNKFVFSEWCDNIGDTIELSTNLIIMAIR